MLQSIKDLFSHDLFLGFLSGVVVTILAFLLTIGWEVYKSRRETQEREVNVLRALNEELNENKTISERNIEMLRQELTALKEHKTIVEPLRLLKIGFWDIAKVNLPKSLLKGNQMLKLRDVAAIIDDCNEQIRSRENYRIHNGAMSNFEGRMRHYDEGLMESLSSLQSAIADYEKIASSQ
jgi:hypothetical protein